MNRRSKTILKKIFPPIVIDLARWARDRKQHREALAEWEVVDADGCMWDPDAGWSHPSIVETQKNTWDDFRHSVRVPNHLGRWPDGSEDVRFHNLVMTFGYVLGRAACGRTHLSILDWGGGLGTYYVFARELFPEITFDYLVKDLPTFCETGRKLLPEVKFVSDDSSALTQQYDLVFASSSAHYSFDFYGVIRSLAQNAKKWLMVTRLPCIKRHRDFVVVQRPHAHGYMTEYPCWFVNRREFLEFVESCGFVLEREFLQAEEPFVKNASEQCRYSGFLFRRKTND